MAKRKHRKKFADSVADRDPNCMWMELGDGYVVPHEGRYAAVNGNLTIIRGADILFQTCVVLLGGRTKYGRLISAYTVAWSALLRELRNDASLLRFFPTHARKFEEFLAGAYHASKWDQVILTPKSGDRGFDVVATKWGSQTCCILDEAKAYKPSLRVNAQIVRALVGSLCLHTFATKARLTTTSSFAPTIHTGDEFANWIPEKLELRDGPEFLRWLDAIASDCT